MPKKKKNRTRRFRDLAANPVVEPTSRENTTTAPASSSPSSQHQSQFHSQDQTHPYPHAHQIAQSQAQDRAETQVEVAQAHQLQSHDPVSCQASPQPQSQPLTELHSDPPTHPCHQNNSQPQPQDESYTPPRMDTSLSSVPIRSSIDTVPLDCREMHHQLPLPPESIPVDSTSQPSPHTSGSEPQKPYPSAAVGHQNEGLSMAQQLTKSIPIPIEPKGEANYESQRQGQFTTGPSSSGNPAGSTGTESKIVVQNSPGILKPMLRPKNLRPIGRNIPVKTNFFKMSLNKNFHIHQFSVKVEEWKHRKKENDRDGQNPAGNSQSLDTESVEWVDRSTSNQITINKNILKCFCRYHNFNSPFAFDGRSLAYSFERIDPMLGHWTELTVASDWKPLPKNNANSSTNDSDHSKKVKVRVLVAYAKSLFYGKTFEKMESGHEEYITALDHMLGYLASVNNISVGRSYYPSNNEQFQSTSMNSSNLLEVWRGFYPSARLSQQGFMLNIDETFSPFWKLGGKGFWELVQEELGERSIGSGFQKQLTNKLKGIRVRATHTGMTFKVHEILTKTAQSHMFEYDGQYVNVAEYYMQRYNILIKKTDWPLVSTNTKKDIYIPMELLKVNENERYGRGLDRNETSDMVKIATSPPSAKQESAKKTAISLQGENQQLGNVMNFSIGAELVQVEGRQLELPQISAKNNTMNISASRANWRGEQFHNPVRVNSWALLCESWQREGNEISKFIHELAKSANKAGVMLHPNPLVTCAVRDDDKYSDVMSKVVKEYGKVELMVIIKNSYCTLDYAEIKKCGDLDLGIVTQVCLRQKIAKDKLEKYCYNLMLKVNAKLGGENTKVAQTFGRPLLNDTYAGGEGCMILGADVSHPMVGQDMGSIAALVGSRDTNCLQFATSLRVQEGRQEIMVHLGDMFLEVFDKTSFKNRSLKSLVMYRDGVSEGQYQQVMENEVHALRRACMNLNMKPKITYIIVTKRHHTRFFVDCNTSNPSGSGYRGGGRGGGIHRGGGSGRGGFHNPGIRGSRGNRGGPRGRGSRGGRGGRGGYGNNDFSNQNVGNLTPGMVVDSVITSPRYFDFYLNSHYGVQGTNKPSKYTVLIDESNLPVNVLESLTYNLTFAFARCNSAVSMVNSTYYAHLLAFRGRIYMSKSGKDSETTSQVSGCNSGQDPAQQTKMSSQPLPQQTQILQPKLKHQLFFV